jgi:hypothetical protein
MPQSARTVFGPSEIARLSSAYDAAVSMLRESSDRAAGLTALEVRRQFACVIIAEAQEGELNPERLKEAALQSLEKPFADPDELDELDASTGPLSSAMRSDRAGAE